ncbi:leukocyte elastase inhibitor-like isoform X1 [Pristis pectinata]|uniref:leukocyte elastase inhibitor-like isoform X1 n=1 Tax=Pristis pectinata TaxID=685728 RepID=UPI00223E5525|nr:leukocyte elastase inhibitor-like isoform X1 [Pristis pectinata]
METPQSTQGQVFISNLFQAGPMQMDPLVSANIQFALDLFKHLDEVDKTVNLFVSPFSISAALAMVHLGAKGTTASQMAEVLSFDKVKDVHSEFQKLQAEFINPKAEYVFKTANRLYGEKTYNFLSEFLEASEKYYQAGLGAVDFVNGAEEARKEINTWIEAQTAGKIKNVFAKHSLKSSMKLILVNATYFRGNWSKQFDKRNTFSGQFKLNQNQVKNVEMMQRTEDFNFIYIHEVATKIIELPYLQDELSMVILLPDDVNGLENLQRSFTLDRLRNWTNPENMYKAKVRVTLPKFKLEEKYDLTLILSRMGMVDAFHGLKANLSGMSRSNDLSLSKVIHQSFVEVNEEGTEAAAVTVISFLKRAVVAREEFMADHPFLFFIRHKKTQSILFYGRLNSP